MMKDLQIVCEIKQIPPMQTFAAAETVTATADFIPLNQHGVWNKGEVTFFVKGEPDELFEQRQNFMKRCFNVAATEWDIEIDLIFTQVYNEDDADIVIEWGTKANDRFYSGENGKFVLAYAGYPNGSLKGYMKIFTDWDWSVKGRYNIVTTIIHELGHIIGRPHSQRKLWKDIMDPVLNSKVTELSEFDIEGGVLGYGARIYSSDEAHDRLEKANRKQKLRLQLEELEEIKSNNIT